MFLAISQQHPGTNVQTRKYKDHKEQVQGYFSPPYGSPKTLKNVKNFPSLPKP